MKKKKINIRVLNAVKNFSDPWHRVKAYNPVGRYFERVTTNGCPEEVQNGGVYGLGAPKNAEVLAWFRSYGTARRRQLLRAMHISA
jgi:hypothetical protein